MTPDFWERRGSQIYTEGDGTPGNSELIAELSPINSAIVQAIVDAHNNTVAHLQELIEPIERW